MEDELRQFFDARKAARATTQRASDAGNLDAAATLKRIAPSSPADATADSAGNSGASSTRPPASAARDAAEAANSPETAAAAHSASSVKSASSTYCVNSIDCADSAPPAEAANTRRFKCVVAYDGTDFCGWQSQASGKSVQDFIEYRLKSIFGSRIPISGSGRTDAGVHARGQVFHFDAPWNHSADALLRAMHTNACSVRVLSAQEVDKSFHARFSARGKRYVYKICKSFAMPDTARYRWSLGGRKTDCAKMKEAAKLFVGEHDFKSFSANRGVLARENTAKTVYRLDVEETSDEITITTEGSGYLYKMVRMIVGALVQCGMGKISAGYIKTALENPARGRYQIQAAPANGLYLDEVFYDAIPSTK